MQNYSKSHSILVDGDYDRFMYGPYYGEYQAITYETEVIAILDTISKVTCGMELLNQIALQGKRAGKHLRIQPYLPEDAEKDGPNNSNTNYEVGEDFHEASVSYGVIYRGGKDNLKTDTDERLKTSGFGKGGGTSATIHFDPVAHYPVDADEILFHEMVHGLRMMHGTMESASTGNNLDKDYDDEEEFLAVVMTNIYTSEKNPHASLRKSHKGHQPLPADLATGAGFLLNNAENLFWIKRLYTREGDYFKAVAANPMPAFNPVGEYVNNQRKYDAITSDVPMTTYTVVRGDTLRGIAKRLYLDANLWTLIYSLNAQIIGAEDDDLSPSLNLRVPVLDNT